MPQSLMKMEVGPCELQQDSTIMHRDSRKNKPQDSDLARSIGTWASFVSFIIERCLNVHLVFCFLGKVIEP